MVISIAVILIGNPQRKSSAFLWLRRRGIRGVAEKSWTSKIQPINIETCS